MKRYATITFLTLSSFLVPAACQAPEIHQLASVAKFTGIYSYIGSYIAIRELYFLVGLISILLAGNVLITFLQLPSMFLPVYHNQRSLEGTGILGDILDENFQRQIYQVLEVVEDSLEKWS